MRLVKTLLEADERWEEMTTINESERLFYINISVKMKGHLVFR